MGQPPDQAQSRQRENGHADGLVQAVKFQLPHAQRHVGHDDADHRERNDQRRRQPMKQLGDGAPAVRRGGGGHGGGRVPY